MLKLKNKKIILLSGVTSDIGKKTITKLLSDDENYIIGIARKKTISNINLTKRYNNLTIQYLDLLNENSLKKLTIFLKKKFIKIDILINLAGGCNSMKKSFDCNKEDFIKQFEKNFLTNYNLTKSVFNLLKKSKEKKIINISSTVSIKPGYMNPHYSASKAALDNFTKYLSNNYSKYGFKINTLTVGVLKNSKMKSALKRIIDENDLRINTVSELINFEKNKIPLKKFGSSEDIANIIYFLSNNENQWIAGSNFIIDGGKLNIN